MRGPRITDCCPERWDENSLWGPWPGYRDNFLLFQIGSPQLMLPSRVWFVGVLSKGKSWDYKLCSAGRDTDPWIVLVEKAFCQDENAVRSWIFGKWTHFPFLSLPSLSLSLSASFSLSKVTVLTTRRYRPVVRVFSAFKASDWLIHR